MPGRDRTGPTGLGAATGRGMGRCAEYAPDDLSVIILKFVFAHWKAILGLILTTALPLISRKILKLDAGTGKVLHLTSRPIKGKEMQ